MTKSDCITLLTFACVIGNYEIVLSLLEKNPFLREFNGEHVDMAGVYSCMFGHYKIVALMLAKGVLVLDGNTGYLNSASVCGHIDVVKLLLQKVAPIDDRALQAACAGGHSEVVKLLLESSLVKVDHQDDALMSASKEGNLDVVKLLLDKGAQIDLLDDHFMSSLMHASRHGHLEVVMLLFREGAKVDLLNTDGDSALKLATDHGHTDIVKFLNDPNEVGYIYTTSRRLVYLYISHLMQVLQQSQQPSEHAKSDKLISGKFTIMWLSALTSIPSTDDTTESKDDSTEDSDEVDTESEEFIQGVQEAISESGKIDRKLAHSMFVGPPGSGKSSLMDRLLNLSLSTGICNPIVIVDVDVDNPSTFHSVTVIDPNTWEEVEYDISLVRQMNVQSSDTSHSDQVQMKPPKEMASPPSPPTDPASGPEHSIGHADQAELVAAKPARTKPSNRKIREMIHSIVKKCGGYKKFN